MFKMYVDINKLPDSMCYDSNTTICTYTNENDRIDIEVRGYVKVLYNGEVYEHYSDMPEELQKLFIIGEAYDDNEIDIQENNWYEVSFNHDENYDVVEVDGYTPDKLEQCCKDFLNLFKSQKKGENNTPFF